MTIQQLGRYRIDGVLGEGAMGVVYRAFDPLLERVVAIKTIKFDASLSEKESFERRFFREAKSVARLSHPAIVTLYDAGKAEDVAYMAMEFLEGRELRRFISEAGPLPYTRIADMMAAVADGLDYAHRQGVVHRDIKPANLMVLADGAVKITDFGIAQLQTGSKTMTGHMLGTPKYMAPEQIMGHPVDGRADIFSLGVVLYQWLTGVAPFDGETVTTIMYRVINEGPVLPTRLMPELPPGFEAILAKALAKSPEERYQTAGELAADLRRYAELGSPGPVLGLAAQAQPQPRIPPSPSEDPTMLLAHPFTDTNPLSLSPAPQEAPASPPARRGKALWLGIAAVAIAGGAFALLPTERSAGNGATPAPAASTAAPEPQPAARVDLAIAPWGEVVVDGNPKGISPPLESIELLPGHHEVEIRNGQSEPHRLTLELGAGDTYKIKHKFK
ncbi:serine/threonine-protein kinase [Azospira sp.]|uniref:serine/threonine-protein kinase n=1 Tax=Azospira sp. TaxID=1872671 RepID=UPI0025697DA2|nr:serine/threonine-protein kinase [Azospira sp.]MDK9690669.1 protein kinase [Azospira sp.]